jgi:cobaltochelatase CobN
VIDTPASALGLLHALHGAGYAVEHPYAHGDELMHALIAGGGHDPEFVTDEPLGAATLRFRVAE